MWESFGWGALGASSLILGGLIAMYAPIGRRLLGLIMAFGAGVLISAVAFELVEEAFAANRSGDWQAAAGLFAGSGAFFAGDWLIDRAGGSERKSMAGGQANGVALAI